MKKYWFFPVLLAAIILIENAHELWTAFESWEWVQYSDEVLNTLWDWSVFSMYAMLSLCAYIAAKEIRDINFRVAWRFFFMMLCISYTISAYRTCIDGNTDGAVWYIAQMVFACILSVLIQKSQRPERERIGFKLPMIPRKRYIPQPDF